MNGTPRPRSLVLPALVALFALAAACGDGGGGEAGFDPGVSDAEIVIGGHAPLSGPAAIFAAVHRSAGAYFDHINETEGGVGGRRIEYRLRDDQYPNPAQARLATQKLVEQDGVFAALFNFGTPTHLAAIGYLNEQGVPDMFFASGDSALLEPVRRYSFSGLPANVTEARTMARYANEELPGRRAGILFQNDDFGREYVEGFRAVFAGEIVGTQAYEASETDTSSQIHSLLDAGADLLVLACTPQPCASAVCAARAAGSDAQLIMSGINAIDGMFLLVGDPDNLDGAIVPSYIKSVCQTYDPAVRRHIEIMTAAGIEPSYFSLGGQLIAELFIALLEQAGDPPTREGLVAAAEATRGLQLDLALGPISMSPTDHRPIEVFQMTRADSASRCFVPVGGLISYESTGG